MKHLLFACFLLISLGTQAQDIRTVYYNEGWDSCSNSKAYYYRTVENKAGSYYVASFYINGTKMSEGALSKWSKDYWSYREGHWKFYHPSGWVTSVGSYFNGKKEGAWKYYRSNSTMKVVEILWKHDTMLSKTFFDSSGTSIWIINYVQNVKVHEIDYRGMDATRSHYYYADNKCVKQVDSLSASIKITDYTWEKDQVVSKSITKNNVLIYKRDHNNVSEFYDNGKLSKLGVLKNGKVKWRHCYGVNGSDTACFSRNDELPDSFIMAAPTFEFKKYLMNSLNYPQIAKRSEIMGNVAITFIVFKDGSIGGVCPDIVVHPILDEEACRVISMMPNWNAAVSKSKSVNSYYTQLILFSLGTDNTNDY